VRVVDFSPGVEAGIIAEKLLIELHTPQAFCAAGYDHDLTRREAIFQLLLPSEYRRRNIQWSEEDVVAVTGGAGGITAACAFSLAKKTGCRMALIGRSPHPDHAPEPDSGKFIAKWLTKYRELGLEARYYCCDVTDKNAVVEIMKKIRTEMGPVTGIIHGAGINHPRLLNRVSPEEAREETAPKVMGALNLLESVGESPPKLIVGMSSIIGMTGMPGNGWYGFSNEAMDLILKRFETDHPETQTLSIAFSVWDELGMGARMGSVEKLKAMGIEPIPVKEGVERFLRQVLSDAGVGRVLVTARLGGLDTWSTTGPPAPGKARYLETLLSATPFVESIFSCRLNLQHDPYLKDHVFNGSYLFPTVFGLEAMAQVAAHVSGQHGFRPVRFQDIRLDRPITVDPQTGAEILLWARMDDSLGQNGTHVIRAGIVKPDDHAERSCFSAMIVLNIQEHPESEIIETPGSPLRIAPSQDLYRPNLLFQGPMFQRLKTVWTLDNARENAETAVFDAAISDASAAAQIAFSNADHQHLYLGDPFFRDTLLQSAQMVVPRQTCLPVRIQNLEIFPKTTPNETALRCRIRVISIDDRQIDTDVVAVDDSGNVLERLSGYRLHILNHQPGNPEARDLVDPQDRDNRRMDELLDQYCNAFGFVKPAFSLGLLENIHWKPVGLRHQLELPIIERAIEAASDMFDIPEHSLNVTWNSENKPEITGQMPEKYGISLSHDSMYCGCVIGPEAQGVDIVEAQHRTRGQWVELLGGSFTELLDKLLDDSDTLDMAGARIWSAKEAVKKAFGNVPGSLNIHRISGEVVVFYAGPAGSVMTFPELLTRGPNRMFAFVVHPQREMSPVILEHTGYVGYDELFDTQHFATIPGGPQGQGMFVHRIPVTFLPNKQLSRTVSFSNYLFWLGDIREASLWPVLETVGKQFASGNYGLVTNRADLHILGEATAKDRVEIRMWVSGNSGSADSTMDLNFDFRKILPGGSHERLAWCEQAVTWVRILEHGIVKPEPYPEYYWNSMKDILPKHDSPNVREPLPEPLKRLRDAETDPNLYLAPSGPVVKPVLRRETFDTSLEHSNLVGNVYFANYYTWQGQTRDRYFFSVIPEHFRGTGESGEMLCLRTWIQHLREAMPFDRIEVTMALKQLKPAMAVLYFEYFRVAPDGVRQKLAYGEHQAHWVTRDKNGHPSPAGFPQKVHRAFADAISEK
jgi:NADP-dependent 3-hydroxy acid dehydrogenase YdfG/acyl-CoA thioesterase FadM